MYISLAKKREIYIFFFLIKKHAVSLQIFSYCIISRELGALTRDVDPLKYYLKSLS